VHRLVLAALVVAATAVGVWAAPAAKHDRPLATAAKRAAVRRKLDPPGPIPGYLLIADRGNNRMLLVDSAHHVYWRYPGGGYRAMPFVFDDDTFFGPRHDRIVSNQEDQDTIQVISFPGKRVLWRYGHVDVKSGAPGYLNTPDDAYLLKNGLVSVADAYNCRVLFISPAHRIVRQYGTTGVCRHDPPADLGSVNGATPLTDGGTLVSEINGSWIDDFGSSGKLRWDVQAPVGYPSDPQLLAPGRILLADYSHPGAAIIMTRAGKVLWRYGPTSGNGELDHPSLAFRIAPGLIAINDDYRDRVVVVSIRTHRIVWQYGHTDRPGSAPGYLRTPDGLDLLSTADAQRFYRLLHAPNAARVSRRTGGGLQVTEPYRLRAPVAREVAVAHDGSILIAGGLDRAQASTAGVFRMNPVTGSLTALGAMPEAFHDAAGAVIGNALYVFGGGAATSSSAVQRFDLATHASRVVAQLSRPLSDVAGAQTPNGVFLVGGYDGHVPRREIWQTRDGIHFRRAAMLPVGLRYPAVATLGATVYIAGGLSTSGPSSRVFALNTRNGKLTSLPSLASPTANAQAFTLGGRVFVAGGTSGAIYRLGSPVARVGSLAVQNGAVVSLPGAALVIGGDTPAGVTATVSRVAARG
jgi:outer membrane protein assembly factor BamB